MEVVSASHRRRSLVPRRACRECQKRKTRCMSSRANSESPTCSYCRQAGKLCTFDALPSRTSLTRKNLDAAESRTRQLESLLRTIRPDLDIDSALHDVVDASVHSDADGNEPRDKQPSPRSADEFEWHETALSDATGGTKDGTRIGDGMANTVAQDAGYLGGLLAPLRALVGLMPPS